VIGVVGSEETELRRSFAESFGQCLLEAPELIPCGMVVLVFALGLCLVGSMVYHLVLDPNAVDVGARLDALSISPDKWIRRS
jgi:sarcosine oxidase gamma subunit